MSGRGLEAQLDALHGLLTDALRDELQAALKRARENPGDPDFAVSPQLLDKVMKFLAQNGVNAPASSPKVDALAAELVDLDLDELAMAKHAH